MPGAFTIGNRVGMFTTVDNGRSWAREEDATGKPVGAATRLRRIGDKLLVSGGMAGPSLIRGADQVDHGAVVADAEEIARPERSAWAGWTIPHGSRPSWRERGAGMSAGMARRAETAGMVGMEGMFMPSDVTRLGDNFVWKSRPKTM